MAKGETINISKAIHQFIMDKKLKNLAKTTIKNYEKVLKEFIELFGDREISEFNTEVARTFFSHLKSRKNRTDNSIGLSQTTLELYYRVVHNFAKWCVKQEYLKSAPTDKIPKPKTETKLPETICDENLQELFDILDNKAEFRIKVIFEFFLDTGCRVSEVMRLNLEDVHIDDGWAKIYGKGSKEAIVPLGERLAIHLHKYLYEVRPNIVKNSQEKAFFVSNRGTRYSKSGLSMLVRRYLKKVGVKGKIGPHKLRHTFATNYLRYEGNLEALRRVMRHSNLQTTQRYLGLLTEDIRNDHRKASPIDNLMKIRNE